MRWRTHDEKDLLNDEDSPLVDEMEDPRLIRFAAHLIMYLAETEVKDGPSERVVMTYIRHLMEGGNVSTPCALGSCTECDAVTLL
jgi:hypothetical protein